MANLSQSEVNSIREVVTGHQTMCAKIGSYASQCQDPQIKQMFTNASQQAGQAAQKLLQML